MDNIATGSLLTIAYGLIALLFLEMRLLTKRLAAVEERSTTVRQPAVVPQEPPAAKLVMEPSVMHPLPPPVVPSEPRFTPALPQPDLLERMARKSGGWEELIGGNLLNKLGAVVLVIGIALFLSYSFANMGPAGRAFTSLALSGTLLVSGIFAEFKERYRGFSRGIMAAGWAGLYVTSYAMYALPAAQIVESPVTGTMLMIAVAIGMVGHSLRYRMQSLTALAFGCILAALALSPLNLFVAVSLVPLAAAMLFLSRRFHWHALAFFAAAGTYAVFLTRPDTGAPLSSIQTMLIVFWLLFEAFDLLRLRAREIGSPWHQALYMPQMLSRGSAHPQHCGIV